MPFCKSLFKYLVVIGILCCITACLPLDATVARLVIRTHPYCQAPISKELGPMDKPGMIHRTQAPSVVDASGSIDWSC
jgi:hypothetical protein